jgi:hypothetical protein
VVGLGPRVPGEIVGPRPLSDVVVRPLNFTVRRRHAARDFLVTLQNEIRKRTKLGKVAFVRSSRHACARRGSWWRLLTIVGGGRDALVVGRRGTREKWWGRGAYDTWSAGASTSPLERTCHQETCGLGMLPFGVATSSSLNASVEARRSSPWFASQRWRYSGCATTSPHALPKYQPPPADAPAAVIDVGPHGRAWSVDGAETPALASTLRLAPGEHRVGINCLSFDILGIGVLAGGPRAPVIATADTRSALQFVLVTGSFEAGKTYYTRCVAVNGQPRAWLADTPDGSELPQGFTSICTRECPR